MPTKLSVMNQALHILGQTQLTAPDAEITSGRNLREAWDSTVAACFEVANWTFLTKRVELGRLAVVPAFGYKYYYELPGDYIRTVQISATGEPRDMLLDYELESGMIATNAEHLYLRYISRDLTPNPGDWSQAFADYVSASLAVRTAPKLNPSALEAASQIEQKNRIFAVSSDAVKNPPAQRRQGSLTRAVTRGSRYNTEQG